MAGHRKDVLGGEEARLLQHLAAQLCEGEAVPAGVVALGAARVLDGLEGHAPHAALLGGELHEAAQLAVIAALFHRDHQGSAEVQLVEGLQGLEPRGSQVGAPQLQEGRGLQGVELKVQLEGGLVAGEPFGKGAVLGDAQAVGVDHEVADGAAAAGVQDLEELGVQGGLTAAELHHVRFALVGHDGVKHALQGGQVPHAAALGAALGIADGAAQVAVVRDLQQSQAAVLLMVRAEAAVVGAAVLHSGVVPAGLLGHLEEDLPAAAVVVHIVGDEHPLGAVARAALQQVDAALLEHDLGVHPAVASGADGHGRVVEEVRAGGGGHGYLAWRAGSVLNGSPRVDSQNSQNRAMGG